MLRQASQQSPLQSPPPRAPFWIAPENVSMHAPAPVPTVVTLPAASPRVIKMVEDLWTGFGVRQPPTVIGKLTSMGDSEAAEAEVPGEEDSQWPEVKALFKGLDCWNAHPAHPTSTTSLSGGQLLPWLIYFVASAFAYSHSHIRIFAFLLLPIGWLISLPRYVL
ncbi:hypothetical protein EV426DRAFT_44152 [Tirmania nivea]|nr:hypothetical protein EV426DRAFT_44152 [Tirmania nivea]